MNSDNDINRLRNELSEKCKEVERLTALLNEQTASLNNGTDSNAIHECIDRKEALSREDINRYSRQLILPEIGVSGQLSLANASVLVVGAGGLGCPAAVYLSAAGLGRLGIVDYDLVELSNLHRQILHAESRIGVAKATSAARGCNQLNSSIKCITHCVPLSSQNAHSIIDQYDIVLDATDNVATRYLLNDACVMAGKTLISGSALRFEGQLTVYNHKGGPCYRCLYPKPPPPETVTNCSDGGVLGVVPGIIGCLQALEAIKIITGIESSFSKKLLLFDAIDGSFQTIRLRPRQPLCAMCGDNPTITALIDYEEFCGSSATDKCRVQTLLPDSCRISPTDYQAMLTDKRPHILLDVRQPVEIEICRLPYSAMNIPVGLLKKDEHLETLSAAIKSMNSHHSTSVPLIVVCRQGNDSQVAVKILQESLQHLKTPLFDIRGGLYGWAKYVNQDFPLY